MTHELILLVEDNPDDVFIMQRALRKTGLDIPVHVVTDGREAKDYLGGTGKFSERAKYPLPSIVFLDLKLPYVNGLEILQWVRQVPDLQALDVVLLTSSSEERDEKRAVQLNAKAYLVKPPTPEALRQILPMTAPDPQHQLTHC